MINWYLSERGGFSEVNGNLVIENKLWASDWDRVSIELIEWTDEHPVYKIVEILSETNNHVSNIVSWVYRNWYVKSSSLDNTIKVESSKDLNDWDIVSWEIIEKKWMSVLKVTRVLAENPRQYTWEYKNWRVELNIKEKKAWVEKTVRKKVIIKSKNVEVNDGDVVCIVLDENWFWEITANLWKSTKKWIDALRVAYESWLKRIDFPKDVLEEVDKIENWATPEEINRRTDHRDLFTITIDWPDAKDLDDAISIEELSNWNTKLYVHIADVSHYVTEATLLFKEALERWNSTYFVDHVVPMLPEKLSNDLCSLNPHTDKLSMTWEMEIDNSTWEILFDKSKVYESVINSNYRTTYKEVQNIFEWDLKEWDELSFWGEINNKLLSLVKSAYKLSDILEKNRKVDWRLDLNTPESKITIDESGRPTWFKQYEMFRANNIIEFFMISANITSDALYWDWPFLHRVHEKPSEAKIIALKSIFEYYEIDFSWFEWTSSDFILLLDKIKDHPKKRFLEEVIVKTQKKARVSEQRLWHFWLWLAKEASEEDPKLNHLQKYSWSTSPIRRFPDLIVHMIIKEINDWWLTDERKAYWEWILEDIAIKTTIREEVSETVEEKVNNYHACVYMSDKIWETFTWYVTYIDERSRVFIKLDNTISWELAQNEITFPLEKINEKLYVINLDDDVCAPWSSVEVTVKDVDLDSQTVYFDNIRLVDNLLGKLYVSTMDAINPENFSDWTQDCIVEINSKKK